MPGIPPSQPLAISLGGTWKSPVLGHDAEAPLGFSCHSVNPLQKWNPGCGTNHKMSHEEGQGLLYTQTHFRHLAHLKIVSSMTQKASYAGAFHSGTLFQACQPAPLIPDP